MQFFRFDLDMIIFISSCLILLVYLFRYLRNRQDNSDDDDQGGDGGQFSPLNDPVLDLPPGVTLPTDTPETELV